MIEEDDARVIGTLAGTVREVLPRALYRVQMDSGHEITAHAPGGAGRNFVRLVVGDRVGVALAGRDITRGRIVKKL
jgi:translation initiation factor IF-1